MQVSELVAVSTDMGLKLACSNYSQDSITSELWTIFNTTGSIVTYERIASSIAIFFIIFMLIGVPWNLIVIVIVLKKRLFQQPAILLLLNLTITDFLLCSVIMPFNIIPAMAREFIFGDTDYVRCQICQVGVLMNILLLMSVYNVALLSLDRFLYVRKPLQYEKIVTVKKVAVLLVACWLLFTVFSLMPVFGLGEVSFGDVVATCSINFSSFGLNISYVYFWLFIIAVSIVPLLILLVTNIWMVCFIRKSMQKSYHRRANSFKLGERDRQSSRTKLVILKEKHKKDQLRLLQIFGAILCASIITWMPTFISIVLLASQIFFLWLVGFGHISLFLQAVIHPILQVIFLRDIRVEITRPYHYLKRKLHKSSSSPDDSGSEETLSGCGRCCVMLDKCGSKLINYNSPGPAAELV